MTTYRVLMSEAFLDTDITLPASFRILDYGPVVKLSAGESGWIPVREATIEDDGAPDELAGRLVDVVLQRNFLSGRVTVASRRAVDE